MHELSSRNIRFLNSPLKHFLYIFFNIEMVWFCCNSILFCGWFSYRQLEFLSAQLSCISIQPSGLDDVTKTIASSTRWCFFSAVLCVNSNTRLYKGVSRCILENHKNYVSTWALINLLGLLHIHLKIKVSQNGDMY